MVYMTQSLSHWLTVNHPDILPFVMFGHLELITHDMYQEYLNWCATPEGKEYLEGGSKYKETKGE